MAFDSKRFGAAQTATILATAGPKEVIVLRRVSVYCSNANTVSPAGTVGFGTAPFRPLSDHPGIAPGSGFAEGATRESFLGQGLQGEPLTFTCGVPTTGAIAVNYTYDLVTVG